VSLVEAVDLNLGYALEGEGGWVQWHDVIVGDKNILA
jgi:hypothetical protein